jgi:hypothetical protein
MLGYTEAQVMILVYLTYNNNMLHVIAVACERFRSSCSIDSSMLHMTRVFKLMCLVRVVQTLHELTVLSAACNSAICESMKHATVCVCIVAYITTATITACTFTYTALHRLLKHLEQRMSFQLRNVITTSLLAWRTFIGQHTPAITNSTAAISNNQTSDGSSSDEQFQVQVEAVVRTPPSLCTPLFDVRMCVSTSHGDVTVQLEPGETGVTAACLGVLDEMVTTVKVSFKRLQLYFFS